jgi:signal transduction histidine kinase
VFDNLFGNIKKYADPACSVDIAFERTEKSLSVVISNTVREGGSSAESTGIGLKICEKIMAQHGGSFRAVREGRRFIAKVSFETGQEWAKETPELTAPEKKNA